MTSHADVPTKNIRLEVNPANPNHTKPFRTNPKHVLNLVHSTKHQLSRHERPENNYFFFVFPN